MGGRQRHATKPLRLRCVFWPSSDLLEKQITLLHLFVTAEAEYIGATEATKETMWLRFLLFDMGLPQLGPTTLHEDNAACLKMATNQIVSARNKHMELKMHYVRERVEAGDIQLKYISTSMQRADILTKNLPRPAFERFRSLLLTPPVFSI